MKLQSLLAIVSLTACAAGPLTAFADPKLLTEEAWYDFFFLERKVGFMMARDEMTEVNGKTAIHAHRWSVLTVAREGAVVRMEFATDVYFEPDGTPLRFTQKRNEGGQDRSLEGYRDGKFIVIRNDVGGNVLETRVPIKGVRLASSLDVLVIQNLKTGYKSEGQALDESEGTLQPYHIEVKGQSKRGGKTVFEVVQKLGPLTTTMWITPKGLVIDSRTAPIRARITLTTKARAIEMPDGLLDIFSSSMFTVPAGIPVGSKLERVVVRLSGRSGKRPPHLTGAGQKVSKKTKGAVELVLVAQDPPSRRSLLPIKGNKTKAYLSQTPYEPLTDARLTTVVAKVVGKERDAWTAAKLINRFVHRHIETKSLAKPFATAVEALEGKEGDCTEHAVLFSALAKIAGIPTRLITGLVYVGPSQRSFGYHEWVEVFIGGSWVAMDPTFGQDVVDPTHIKFTEGQSDPDGLREAGLMAATLIGDMRLEVLEYTTVSGKTKKL